MSQQQEQYTNCFRNKQYIQGIQNSQKTYLKREVKDYQMTLPFPGSQILHNSKTRDEKRS